MKTHWTKRIVALTLILLLLPLQAILEEGASASFTWLQRTYETGRSLFQLGDLSSYDRARNVFAEAGNYQDSGKYLHYIDATKALEAEDYESAAIIFQVLGDVSFLDAARQYEYTQARRAEQDGQTKSAMILYARAEVRDAPDRFDALQSAHPEIDITKDDLPDRAREGGYAYVMEENLPAMNEPAGNEALFTFPLFEVVKTLTFAYDAEGHVWAAVSVVLEKDETESEPETEPETGEGYLPVSALHVMTEAEEANYQQALLAAPPPPTDHYGRVTTGGVHIRPEADKKSGSNGEAKRKDIVELLSEVTGVDGEPWFEIVTAEEIEGFLQARYIEELTDEEDAEHRALIGRVPEPVPIPTPMPTPEPTPSAPVSRDIPEADDRPYAPFTGAMTDAEKYDRALFLLLDGREEALREVIALLTALGDYQNALIYLPLAELLLLVEQKEFKAAKELLEDRFAEGYFDAADSNNALEIKIPGADTLFQYICAREAEANGDAYLAVALFDELDFFDSASRMLGQYRGLEAPTVGQAVQRVTPGKTVTKPKRPPTLSEGDLASMKALYDAMSGGDLESAGQILLGAEYAEIFNSVFEGEMYLFDGVRLHAELEGTGLVLRDFDYAFFGEFAIQPGASQGRPHGECAVVFSHSTGGHCWTYTGGHFDKGIKSGEVVAILYDDDGSISIYRYALQDGYYVMDGRWKKNDDGETVLPCENDPNRSLRITTMLDGARWDFDSN